jgi:hypothetical protein
MPCSNLVIWRPIPAGNRFAISAEGKDDNFNITVAVDCDSGVQPPWRHDDIVPGPKKLTIAANDSCTLTIFVSVLSISGDPMSINAWIETPDGTKTDKQCKWSFSEPGNFQIMINLDNQ